MLRDATTYNPSMILFLVFFPRGIPDTSSGPHHAPTPRIRDAIIVGVTSLFVLLAVGITSTALIVSEPQYLILWANFLGITASIFSSIQYIPQLYTTWRLKHIFSLSIATMCVQVPGSFVFAFSLWLRVGWQGWSAWCVYCVSGCLQGGLLAMAISFWLKERREGKVVDGFPESGEGTEDGDAVMGASERDPLLAIAAGRS